MSDPPTAAAASTTSSDETIAQALYTVMQLTEVYGFDARAAEEAVNEVGVNVEACANYILEKGIGQDNGGPVTPITDCPHVDTHLTLKGSQIPLQPKSTRCTQGAEEDEKAITGGLKSDEEQCGSEENWLCLSCGVVRCSRYVKGHAMEHYEETKQSCSKGLGHCLVASLADLSVWCHGCQAYLFPNAYPLLDNLMKTLEERKFKDGD